MKWRVGRRSSNVEDRRGGGGGMGMGLGGMGIGGIILVVGLRIRACLRLAWRLTGDLA